MQSSMAIPDKIKLAISLMIDLAGMAAYFVPFIGYIINFFIAMLGAAWIKLAYGTTKGAIFGFIEEMIPIAAFIPTCTLIHFFRDNPIVKRLMTKSDKRRRTAK